MIKTYQHHTCACKHCKRMTSVEYPMPRFGHVPATAFSPNYIYLPQTAPDLLQESCSSHGMAQASKQTSGQTNNEPKTNTPTAVQKGMNQYNQPTSTSHTHTQKKKKKQKTTPNQTKGHDYQSHDHAGQHTRTHTHTQMNPRSWSNQSAETRRNRTLPPHLLDGYQASSFRLFKRVASVFKAKTQTVAQNHVDCF